jgi:A/G-specific adenine glycosylase
MKTRQSKIRRQLLGWYDKYARELPWRNENDPYRVWISEVMLQQTRVETVTPYYQRWLEQFPTLNHLAQADEQEVLKTWEGLGYYSRARNLLKSAKIIQHELGGDFPRELTELKKLPGVGSYIAGAIASIAFGKKTPALDGNGKRVLARLNAFHEPVNQERNTHTLEKYLFELLPDDRAGDFNQAIMDLGSRICLPRRPRCGECPLQSLCEAYRQGVQLEIPVRTSKRPVPHYPVVAAVIRDHDQVLIDQRRAGDLMGGMWEFPGGKVEQGESLADAIVREIREELGLVIRVVRFLNVYEHAYTHFSVKVHAIECEIITGEPQALESDAIAWVPVSRLDDFPMGKVDRLISRELQADI